MSSKRMISNLWPGFSYDSITGILYRDFDTAARKKGPVGCPCRKGYLRVTHQKRSFAVHRIVLEIFYGIKIPENKVVDHLNGNITDNRISNLRITDRRGNGQNQIMHRNGRLVGVLPYKTGLGMSYRARIVVNGKQVSLGSFKTELEAHNRYRREAVKYE